MPLRQPFMNWKEARIKLCEMLEIAPKRLKTSSVRGGKTYYLADNGTLDLLTEEKPEETPEDE